MANRPRNIVLLSDGTGNSRSKHFTTNVWRIYEALDLEDPVIRRHPRQFAFYDDGVGSSSFKLFAILGGAFGIGLARNVRDLYRSLCRTYRPGDRIYGFGFSRGAFTIRVLVGLIMNQGIVPYDGNEAELDRLSKAAWRAYRRERFKLAINYIALFRWLRDALITGWALVRGLKPYAKVQKIGLKDSENPVHIEFLGLWDTVDAYGLPIDEFMRGIDRVVWPGTIRDLRLSERVKRAVHALALDDERNTFHPRLWIEEPGQAPERISQVWFAGMHADVGGGYPDQGLSHISLDWVADAAQQCGLRMLERVRARQRALSDENGPMNDSRRGLAGYYRYNPRRMEPLFSASKQPAATRPKVHESVLRRIRDGQDAYAPIVLPFAFDVVRLDGQVQDGATYLGIDPATSAQQAQAFHTERERVFNRVWYRRVTYFTTLALTVALLAQPLLSGDDSEACTSALCGLSPLIRGLDLFLPSFASGWTAWYAANPGRFLLLGVPVLVGLWLGGVLQQSIGDAMRRVWYAIGAARPTTVGNVQPARAASRRERAVQALRTSAAYQRALWFLTWHILPACFLLTLGWATLTLGTSMVFAMRASGGDICLPSATHEPVGETAREFVLGASSLCAPTQLGLEAGGTYQLTLSVVDAAHQPLKDSTLPADLRGVRPADAPWFMYLGIPLRREMKQPWLAPMARVGDQGADLYPLKPDPSVPTAAPLERFETRIVARSTGELFLYLNDAVGPPWDVDRFYRFNHGKVRVSISRVAPDSAPPAASGEAAAASAVPVADLR